jgi:hypothetical protein
VPASWDRYRERLVRAFSEEAEPLARAVDVLRAVGGQGRSFQNRDVEASELAERAPSCVGACGR